MIPVVLAVLSACTMASGGANTVRSDSLLRLYREGKTWQEFFDGAKARRETWRENYQVGEPAVEAVARARAVGGTWRILVVAEDWCGDSANTIPYLVRFVEQVPGLEVRIVNSTAGRWVMTSHLTPDGRAATPTVVLIDASGTEDGCFVERPAPLRAWTSDNRSKLSEDEFQKGKMAWYREDRGKATVAEFVAMLESAAKGKPLCG